MDLKNHLMSYRKMKDIIRIKQDRLAELEALLTYTTPKLDDMPRGHADPKERRTANLAEMMDLKDEVERMSIQLTRIELDAMRMLDTITDTTVRWVMYQRYMAGRSWKRIASDAGYTERRILQLHGDGLADLRERYGDSFQ